MLPAASGASPRLPERPASGVNTTEQELKMVKLEKSCSLPYSDSDVFILIDTIIFPQLNWYKLANEAAMKAALVKHKRAKEAPRYNPAAERVRQRAEWIEQVRFHFHFCTIFFMQECLCSLPCTHHVC